jgi:hypothetical protein
VSPLVRSQRLDAAQFKCLHDDHQRASINPHVAVVAPRLKGNMTAFGLPVLVDTSATARVLPRISLSAAGQGAFSEEWLQKTLFAHPECLPLEDLLHPDTAKVIPVCMELPTPAGPADILYLTPSGKIVLVETKLFRNPEARRQVIAQIIDYAKELSLWTYEDLAKAVAQATKKPTSFVFETIRARAGDVDEARFIDGVNRSLAAADMLLLIAGDGIRSGLESLVSFFDRHAMLRYSMALVEVGVFMVSDQQLLIQPRVLAKTKVVERMVFSGAVFADQSISRAAPPETPDAEANAEWAARFWTEFLRKLRLDDGKQPLPTLPRAANIYFPMPPGPSFAWVSAYIAKSKSEAGVYLQFSKRYDRAAQVYEQLLAERDVIDGVLGPDVVWCNPADGPPVLFKMKIGNLDDATERARVQAELARRSNLFVNAFRDRLARLTEE